MMNQRTNNSALGEVEKRVASLLKDSEFSCVIVCYLYGFYARNQQTPLSDLDLAILMDEGYTVSERVRVSLKLSRQMTDAMGGVDVDVRTLNDAPLEYRYNVIREGRVVFSRDEGRRLVFESRALMEYFDFKPMIQMYKQYMHRRIEETGRL